MKKIIILLITMLLFVLFTYTAFSKFLNLADFQATLEESPFIGHYYVYVSYLLPLLELAVAALLLLPRTRRSGLYMAFWLMLFFSAYVGYMLLFTPDLPCSCGGVVSELSWPQHLLFNLFFTVLAYIGYHFYKPSPPPPETVKRTTYHYE